MELTRQTALWGEGDLREKQQEGPPAPCQEWPYGEFSMAGLEHVDRPSVAQGVLLVSRERASL